MPNQTIEIKVEKTSDVTSPIVFSFSPNPSNNISLAQVNSTTWNLSVSEFQKANSETLLITATAGSKTDSFSVFKTTDGIDALAGGLTNPLVALPIAADGTIDNTQLTSYLNSAGGQFVVFKGGEELTGDSSKVSYSIFSSTEGLSISIGSDGVYTVSSFDVAEENGQAILVATDVATGQQFKTRYSIVTVKRGQQGESGPQGSTGTDAKTVKLNIDDSQIAYLSDDTTPSPTSITAVATPQNHAGTVNYEFIVYEGLSSIGTTLYNGTSNIIVLTDTNKNYGAATYKFISATKTEYGRKTLKVKTRQNSTNGTVIAEDSVAIIATKDGSDALEVVFPNNNHTFVADSIGRVSSYSGGGSIVQAYIGNEQLTPVSSISEVSSGQFKIEVQSQSGITSGVQTIDAAQKTLTISDPTGMSDASNNASITYLITAKNSQGIQKSQIVKASFSKAKEGSTAKVVSLSVDDGQIAYLSNDSSPSPTSITVTAAQKNHSGLVHYEFMVFEPDNPSGVTLRNTVNNVLTLTNTNTNYGSNSYTFIESTKTAFGKSKTIKVITREDSPSSTAIAQDTITIVATKDGSDALEVVFPNNNHTFTAANDGTVASGDYADAGSYVEAYIGNEQLSPTLTNPPGTGQFNVVVASTSNIQAGTPSVQSATKRILTGAPQAMSQASNSATINYTINGKSTSGISKSQSVQVSFSKAKKGDTGAQGSSGTNGRTVKLDSSRYQIAYDSNGALISSAAVTLTATAFNGTGTLTYKFFKDGNQIDTNPISQNTKSITSADFPAVGSVRQLSVELYENGTKVATDSITLVGTKDGSNAITTVLSNDNHTFTADKDGNVDNTNGYNGSGTTVNLYVGNTALTALASGTTLTAGTFKVVVTVLNGSITVPTPTGTGTTTLTFGNLSGFTSDNASINFAISFIRPNGSSTETINKTLTYSKSKVGATGANGTNGSSAKTIRVSVDKQFFSFDNANDTTADPTSIAVTINQQNLTSAIVAGDISIKNSSGAVISVPALTTNVTSGTGTITFTLQYDATNLNSKANLPATITVTKDGVSDTITIYKVEGGVDSGICIFSNESHTLPASSVGVVSSYVGSGTDIKVFVGTTELAASTSTSDPASNNTFTVTSVVLSPASFITVGGRSVVSTTTLRFADFSSMNNDVDGGTVTYTIRAKDNNGVIRTFTKIQSLTKSKAGTDGIDGTDGVDTTLIYDFNQTFQYDSSTLVPYGWNITPSSSTDLNATNVATSVLSPKFSPSGAYNYPYLSGSGYIGRIGASSLPIGITVSSSPDSKYGGKLGNFCIQSLSSSAGTNQAYVYTSQPIPISVGNTYELAFRVKQNTNFVSTKIGLFFFDINGSLITQADSNTSTITYAQTSFPTVINAIDSGVQTWTADKVISYYSFESGGSLKTFPSNAKYVKPYIAIKYTSTTNSPTLIRQVLIDYLYFGEKTTPNTRNGIFFDNITGRVSIGASNADVAGDSGGLTESKYDAVANFEIITGSDVADIRLTRGYSSTFGSVNSEKSDVDAGVDFAALRFAGWTGVFQGQNNTSNMVIDERAEIRACYMRTGSSDPSYGALGGAALDFYTAPSRTTTGSNNTSPTSPLLRFRISSTGQALFGYQDIEQNIVEGSSLNPDIGGTLELIGSNGSFTPVYTPDYLYSASFKPLMAVNGPILAGGLLIDASAKPSYINNRMMVKSITPIVKTAGQISVIWTGSLGEPEMRWPTVYADSIYGTLFGDMSGDTSIVNGNLRFITSGKGIDFSSTTNGTTMSNELLDDYEEGTWQPTLAGSTTTGNYVYHSGGRDGHYTKIGDMVYITCIIYIQSVSTAAAGNLSITGLPFTVKNTTYDMYSAQIPQWGGLASDIVHVGCLFTKNATTIQLYKKESSASSNTPKLEGADIGAETSFRIFGFYKV